MTTKNEIMIVDEESIKHKVYTIRDVQVMLDFELAEIYGYSTKAFNQQIKRNIDKFEGYIFQLSKEELTYLTRSQFVTPIMQEPGTKGGRTYLPYAFTESGIYMLMTVLRGSLATEQSRKLINIFQKMKDYLFNSKQITVIDNIIALTSNVHNQEKRIEHVENKVDVLMDNFFDTSRYKEFLIMNGEKFEADVMYNKIYKTAKHTIKIVDDYIGTKTLELLKGISKDIKVTIYSDNINNLSEVIINDFIASTNIKITVQKTNHLYHDRFILIDETTLYLSGPSSKDVGNKIGMLIEIQSKDIVTYIINNLTH